MERIPLARDVQMWEAQSLEPGSFPALKGRRNARYDPAAPNARCYPR